MGGALGRGSPCKWPRSGVGFPARPSWPSSSRVQTFLQDDRMAIETTTRAYTLRLAEADDSKWREHLWTTHCTVNRGVWTWGDWLLTLRGGLPASLADK